MISRRGFLGWLSVAPLASGVMGQAALAARGPKNSVVVFDDITGGTDAAYLRAALDRCAAAGIPITCLVETGSEGAARLQPSNPVAEVLREAAVRYGGLLEICPFISELGQLTPYFQARSAFAAQEDLARAIWGASEPLPGAARLIGCDLLPEPLAPGGLRSAGIRTVLMRPAETVPIRSEAWDTGIVRIKGGVRLQSADRQPPLKVDTNSEQIYYVPVGTIGASQLEKARFDLDRLIETVRPQQATDWRAPVLAADVGFRDDYRYERMLSLHLASDGKAPGTAVFQATLRSLNIPFTTGPRGFGRQTAKATSLWLPTQSAALRNVSTEAESAKSFFKTETRETRLDAGSLQQAEVALWHQDDSGCAGLDSSNILRMPTLLVEGDQVFDLGPNAVGSGDRVIVVTDAALEKPHGRNALKKLMLEIQGDGYSSIVSLGSQVRALLPDSPSIRHHRRTAAYRRSVPPTIAASKKPTLDSYIDDARLAWSYFEKWSHPKTGLCPATVHTSGGKTILHEAVTMWDVGSHINALIAAHQLDLISKKAFRRAIDKIRPNLAGRRSQGRLLPQGWIVTNRIKWGIKDFDGCDAGRLLSSLYRLDDYGIAGQVAEPIVASWDLPEIIREGVIHSVTDGQMISTYKSHCAHYAAWAFKIWGMDAVSPYETFRSRSDGEMALLEAAGKIGPLGAEPLLLEALELEMSPEAAYLADVLFAAQLEERRETGKLTCVSESPVDRAPWFVYSGIDLSKDGRVWATDTVDSLPEHRTADFAEEHVTISSKAAYLWQAYTGHEYAGALVDHVRERGRSKYGFRSGIYRSTGEATRNTDLNTNAIILQSIAKLVAAEA